MAPEGEGAMGQIERTDAAMPLVPPRKDVGQVSQVRQKAHAGGQTGRQAQAAPSHAQDKEQARRRRKRGWQER